MCSPHCAVLGAGLLSRTGQCRKADPALRWLRGDQTAARASRTRRLGRAQRLCPYTRSSAKGGEGRLWLNPRPPSSLWVLLRTLLN